MVVHCWPFQPTYWRSSSQIGHSAGGSSDIGYCTPQVTQIQACGSGSARSSCAVAAVPRRASHGGSARSPASARAAAAGSSRARFAIASAWRLFARPSWRALQRSSDRSSAIARVASGTRPGCLTRHRPVSCSTTSFESRTSSTSRAPSAIARSSARTTPVHSATLLVWRPSGRAIAAIGGASGSAASGRDASISTAPADAGPGLPRAAPSARIRTSGRTRAAQTVAPPPMSSPEPLPTATGACPPTPSALSAAPGRSIGVSGAPPLPAATFTGETTFNGARDPLPPRERRASRTAPLTSRIARVMLMPRGQASVQLKIVRQRQTPSSSARISSRSCGAVVARVEDEAVRVDDRGRADVRGLGPERRARARCTRRTGCTWWCRRSAPRSSGDWSRSRVGHRRLVVDQERHARCGTCAKKSSMSTTRSLITGSPGSGATVILPAQLVDADLAGQPVAAVDQHRVRAAHAVGARAAEGQRPVRART